MAECEHAGQPEQAGQTGQADFEKQIARLEEVTALLEKGGLTLEDSVALYKEGLTLSKNCRALLEQAKNEVEVYASGQPVEGERPED